MLTFANIVRQLRVTPLKTNRTAKRQIGTQQYAQTFCIFLQKYVQSGISSLCNINVRSH